MESDGSTSSPTRHRRSSTSTSLQFTLSPSISPPAVSESSAGRHGAFSNVSQPALSEEAGLEVGSSTSTASYRLQTPGTPEWSWVRQDAPGQPGGSSKDVSTSSPEQFMMASPLSSPTLGVLGGGEQRNADHGEIVSLASAPFLNDEQPQIATAETSTRHRAATVNAASDPIPIRPGKRERSLSLSTLLRQKLQRSKTEDKPSWKSILKRGDSSPRVVTREPSAASSTTSLGSPEIPLKRPGLRSHASSAFNINSRSKSNISLTLPRSYSTVNAAVVTEQILAEPVKDPVDYFGLLLPKELQLHIFQTLLDVWMTESSSSRWSGEAGGRRELIKLSRVSFPTHLY
jgi:hypothetical protein